MQRPWRTRSMSVRSTSAPRTSNTTTLRVNFSSSREDSSSSPSPWWFEGVRARVVACANAVHLQVKCGESNAAEVD